MPSLQEALAALPGVDAPNLSPGVISRLTAGWQQDHDRWQRRDLSARSDVCIRADGVCLQARMELTAECVLVVIGAMPEGRKELLGVQVGVRESARSRRELLVDPKGRGPGVPPKPAIGDGALGFRKALDEVFPGTRHQRCWFHKMSNVLDHFPKSLQPAVTADLREIPHVATRVAALATIETFKGKCSARHARGFACLTKDTGALLAFYDFPAGHRDPLRTSNPIESVFATVRHRTVRTRGALSQKTAKLLVFTPIRAASRTWRRLNGTNRLSVRARALTIEGVRFTDGVAHCDATQTRAA